MRPFVTLFTSLGTYCERRAHTLDAHGCDLAAAAAAVVVLPRGNKVKITIRDARQPRPLHHANQRFYTKIAGKHRSTLLVKQWNLLPEQQHTIDEG